MRDRDFCAPQTNSTDRRPLAIIQSCSTTRSVTEKTINIDQLTKRYKELSMQDEKLGGRSQAT